MSTLQTISNQVIHHVNQHYHSRFAIGSAIFGTAVTVEMACSAAKAFKSIYIDPNGTDTGNEAKKVTLSAGMAGAAFYGLCAANLLPRTAVFGATAYIVYALVNGGKQDAYFIAKTISKTYDLAWKHIITPVLDNIVEPIATRAWNHVIKPIANGLVNLVGRILKVVRIPVHPTWYALAILMVAIAAKKLYSIDLIPNISFQSPIKFK